MECGAWSVIIRVDSLIHGVPERGERQRTAQRRENPADAEAAEVDMPVGGGEEERGEKGY